jgi:hypothetical protein
MPERQYVFHWCGESEAQLAQLRAVGCEHVRPEETFPLFSPALRTAAS